MSRGAKPHTVPSMDSMEHMGFWPEFQWLRDTGKDCYVQPRYSMLREEPIIFTAVRAVRAAAKEAYAEKMMGFGPDLSALVPRDLPVEGDETITTISWNPA